MKKITLLLLFLVANVAMYAQQDSAKVLHAKTDTTDQDANDPNAVEVMPEFPNPRGVADPINEYLSLNTNYPQFEKEQGKQGTVYVSFIIEKDGSVSNVEVAKGVPGAPGLGREAVRVIKAMPKWTPATRNGKPVRLQMTIPVKFVLDKGKKSKRR